MKKNIEYVIKNFPSNVILFLENEFEVLAVISFDKDIYKTKKDVFENIIYCCRNWDIPISRRKANEIAQNIKWGLK